MTLRASRSLSNLGGSDSRDLRAALREEARSTQQNRSLESHQRRFVFNRDF